MERYADGLAILVSQRDLAHFTFLIQDINNGSLNIVLGLKILYNHLALQMGNFQLQQSFSILRAVIPKTNPKHLRLDVELLKKCLDFLNRYYVPIFSGARYKGFFRYV